MTTISVPITSEWRFCTPPLYRFLPDSFTDDFFSTGSLRLSSFAQFAKHKDEQRLDLKEGQTLFVHRTLQREGQTMAAHAQHGQNAYVLCTTMRCDEDLKAAFGCRSYIRIEDSLNFAAAVSRHIPGFSGGCEGPCVYQDHRIIERDLGYIDIEQFRDPADPTGLSQTRTSRFINDHMGHIPFFLKLKQYAGQCEYRFLWMVPGNVAGHLDIKVPEAIQFCSKAGVFKE